MRLRYDTGTAFGFVRGGAVVVLPEGASSELVRVLWDGIDAAGETEVEVIEVIQTLTTALGATLRSMPPFAVAVVSGRRVQVAVRGEVSVTLSTATERVHIDGDGVTTWSERLVEDVETVSVQLGVDEAIDLAAGPGQVALAGLPLGDGVVLMSRIVRDLVDSPRVPVRAPQVTSAAPAGLVTTVPQVGAPVEGVAGYRGPEALATVPAPEPTVSPDAPASSGPTSTAASGGTGEPPVDVEPLAALEPSGSHDVPGVLPDGPVSYETIAPEATITPETDQATITSLLDAEPLPPSPAPEPEPEPVAPVESGYGHLWESTVLRTVEDAAIRVDENAEADEDVPAPPVASSPPVDGDAAPAAPAQGPGGSPWALDEPPTGAGASMIDGVPREWTGSTPGALDRARTVEHEHEHAHAAALGPGGWAPDPVPAQEPEPEPETEDHDGHTVFSSVVADLRAQVGGRAEHAAPHLPVAGAHPGQAAFDGPLAPAAPAGPVFAPPPPPGAQQILARVCTEGHPNPASRDACGRCGGALPGDARLVTRPSLGRLTLSNGQVVELDRPVVLGRRPRTTRAQSNDLPRLVAVPSPEQDISRSHVEIQLEEWHVFVCDLNTTNGTTLLRPGQPPRRLHPGEPMMVASHDVVDVGDGVTFVFEDLL
ncbi:MAG: hypothetical protein K0R97_334 [Oerskovia sp.]|nr:hypothetical protein [Oerskovia sp.]